MKKNRYLIDSEEEILIKRADEISKIPSYLKENTIKGREFMVFSVNKVKYAIEKIFLQELYLTISPTNVPSTPSFIKGIVNVRGEIVSVTDLICFLGLDPVKNSSHYQAMRIKGGNNLEFIIIIDDANQILELENSDINLFPISSDSTLDKYCKGVTQDFIYVLDMDKILSDERIIVEDY